MGLLRTTTTERVKTAFPVNSDPNILLEHLRDYPTIIKLNPYVSRAESLAPSPADLAAVQAEAEHAFADALGDNSITDSTWHTYSATEKVPGYGTLDFTAAYRAADKGTVAVVRAPRNLSMLWRAQVQTMPDGSVLLDEEATFHLNPIYSWFVTYNFRKAHSNMHQKLIEEVRKDQLGRRSAVAAAAGEQSGQQETAAATEARDMAQ